MRFKSRLLSKFSWSETRSRSFQSPLKVKVKVTIYIFTFLRSFVGVFSGFPTQCHSSLKYTYSGHSVLRILKICGFIFK